MTTVLLGAVVAAVFLGLRRFFRVEIGGEVVPCELDEWRSRRALAPTATVRKVNGGESA